LYGRRNPFVAQEGIPLLLLVVLAILIVIRYFEPVYAAIPAALLLYLILVFRDPHRYVPSVALGVFSPVDGKVVAIERIEKGATGAPAQRVVIAVDSLGSYTARSPVEGTVKDLRDKALWLQTDEGEDLVLRFRGFRLGLVPRALAGFGERLGQGQRCVYLRLTRTVEVEMPDSGKVLVESGAKVTAGTDLIGTVLGRR
jgi:phosphatidylserine decarboxylase